MRLSMLDDDFTDAIQDIASLEKFVHTYLDDVRILSEDQALRENRIRLLIEVEKVFKAVADFSKIQLETAIKA